MLPTAAARTPDPVSACPNAMLWQEIQDPLRVKMGDATYNSWISPLEFKEFISGRYVITAPTRFMRDWVKNNVGDQILKALQEEFPSVLALDIIVRDKGAAPSSPEKPKSQDPKPTDWSAAAEDDGDESLDNFQGSTLDKRFTFENFVVGKPNELAYAAARRVAESETVTF